MLMMDNRRDDDHWFSDTSDLFLNSFQKILLLCYLSIFLGGDECQSRVSRVSRLLASWSRAVATVWAYSVRFLLTDCAVGTVLYSVN